MNFSDIPSTTALLQSSTLEGLKHRFALLVVQDATQRIREHIRHKKIGVAPDWEKELAESLRQLQQKRYQKVINATGIVIHTNLGRAPISKEIFHYAEELATGYCDLEMDIRTGKRGGRISGIRTKLCHLTGAEDALVVNNNAAAIFLVIAAICGGKEVIISRSELVEIGGSFRVPDMIKNGGAVLKEVGTTNRTHLRDYQQAISEQTAALLKIHPSNFTISGFVTKPSRSELSAEAHRQGIWLIEDLGSGLLHQASSFSSEILAEESIVRALEAGADIVTFSGDKLLGAGQVGIIVGKKDLIARCRQHPLYRILRLGKVSLSILEAALQLYIEDRADELPIWEMMNRPLAQLSLIASRLADPFAAATVQAISSYSGGGALPEQTIPSVGAVFEDENIEHMARYLRSLEPPILARIHNDQLIIDPRTVFPDEVPLIQAALEGWYQQDR